MSKRDKLIEKIRSRPAEADFADVRKIFEMYGWQMRPSSGGSHFIFEKKGEFSFSVPTVGGRAVKRFYLAKICELLGIEVN
jgi:predicted RNA binding protein YcfA (HicA-like mRNA interferase family)